MAVTIEGYTVVVQKERVEELLNDGSLEPPNAMAFADDDLWRCSFMAHADAEDLMGTLARFDLNVTCGPNSDAVLVSEFDQSIEPYCEWLETGTWAKAVIAWKAGTDPKTVVAREGWDPEVGSGLTFHDPSTMNNLEFLRLEDNVEVFLDRNSGKEVYIGRSSTPVDSLFSVASDVIRDNFVNPGGAPLAGEPRKAVSEAIEQLRTVLDEAPEWWNALWFHGKGQMALGNYEAAYDSLRRAYEIEANVEAISRELAGACLELGKFGEAVEVAQRSAGLAPDNAEVVGNLSVAHLMAGNVDLAQKSIDAALHMDPEDRINNTLACLIREVASGTRRQPLKFSDLTKPAPRKTKPFWKFW